MSKSNLKFILNLVVYAFATIGFVLVVGYFAVKFGFTNTKGVIDRQRDFFKDQVKDGSVTSTSTSSSNQQYIWSQGTEWSTFKAAVTKDQVVLTKAAQVSGVSPRLILSMLVVEQLRLFYTSREVYKAVFEPLQVLGSQSQFSWGVMGIKQDTAREIENHLKDKASPFYLGSQYEHILDFKTGNPDEERFMRLTDEHDHYYSYLYAGLYIKQVVEQWRKAGFDISHKPGVIATLFNIGFSHSKPHSNPDIGGAEIEIRNKIYSFGSLAQEFYNSQEMRTEFLQ